MAAQYPELEAIPPRQPSLLARVFSVFPLVTLPPAASSIEVPHTPTRPVLYVAPGHPRASSSNSAGPSASTTWTSSDVRCLRRQVDLTFRAIDFDIDQIPSAEAWGPSSSRNPLPFLDLPSTHKDTTATSSNRLLGDDGLSVWAENNDPLPFERKEDGNEKRALAGAPFASVDVKEEALVWSALLENGLMAAALLAQLSAPPHNDASSSNDARPLFSQLLQAHLSSSRQAREINKIHALHTCSSPTSSLSRWTSSVPGMSFQWIGLGASGSLDSEDDSKYLPAVPEGWDEEGIAEEGCRAIEAVAARMEEDGSSSWLFGASHPTSLDALLFAQLHTLLSLQGSNGTARRLRETVLSREVLTQWTRRIYDEYIKPKETAWGQ